MWAPPPPHGGFSSGVTVAVKLDSPGEYEWLPSSGRFCVHSCRPIRHRNPTACCRRSLPLDWFLHTAAGPPGSMMKGSPSHRSASLHHSASRSTPSDAGPRPSRCATGAFEYEANESSLHGAAPLQNRHYAYRYPVYRIEARSRTTVFWLSRRWLSRRLLTKLLTNRFDLDRLSRYSGGRSRRSASCQARANLG